MKRIALTAFLVGLAFGPARVVQAAAFRVTPIRVNFDQVSKSALLTLINESNEALRFQISAFEWGQSQGSGQMQLKPTTDIKFFPTLLSLKPGEERKVRVGTNLRPGPVEKTYRIFFEELPGLQKTDEPEGAQVKIITKMGVPIFVAPEQVKASGEVTSFSISAGKLLFDVQNRGNVHFVALSIRVVGSDGAGNVLFDKQREGWYVLSGGSRSYDLELTPSECGKLQSVRVEVQTDLAPKPEDAMVKGEFRIPTVGSGCR